MADIADLAQVHIERDMEKYLKTIRDRGDTAAALVSAEYCQECGYDIPQLRRDLVPGCKLCVECQAETER